MSAHGELVARILAVDPAVRDAALETFAAPVDGATLLREAAALDGFRRDAPNLYERVRALFLLYALHRFHLPGKAPVRDRGLIPGAAVAFLLDRRFDEAIDVCLHEMARSGPSAPLSSALAAAYHGLGFATLAEQVRQSVRQVRGNRWLFRVGHSDDHPLRLQRALLPDGPGLPPVLTERTPVRMDLTHSAWSDIFFLGMDHPEGAKVVNVSIDLAVRGRDPAPTPPIECRLRVIDRPVLRLVSVDLAASADLVHVDEVFDFARDYLGLLKAAVIGAGLVPPGLEGADVPLAELLGAVLGRPGLGLEIVSHVRGIPKGSRLAVSTNLLASLILLLMRATGQTERLVGAPTEGERRTAAARAILGEWLGGSGGGWQDSGGLWPGAKLIEGQLAQAGDPEFGKSRGRLLPAHRLLGPGDLAADLPERLQQSLVLVHGGMAQDVGPVLEMVTEKYLLRSAAEWRGRRQALQLLEQILAAVREGDLQALGALTTRNFEQPIQTIIPAASNLYTETLIADVRERFGASFWGFWMLGGMSGGGMGFLFDPAQRPTAADWLQQRMLQRKRELERALPFAMDPVVYDFAVNERGSVANLADGAADAMPGGYYVARCAHLQRDDRSALDALEAARGAGALAARPVGDAARGANAAELERLLDENGFDRIQHEQIRSALCSGSIGLARNRLPAATRIDDAAPGDVLDSADPAVQRAADLGRELLRSGSAAVLTLAAGAGSRWTQGAGVVKALNPFVRLGGAHRSFLDIHLAKSNRTAHDCGTSVPHLIATSYLTHAPIEAALRARGRLGEAVRLSPGRTVGLRLVPMVRDLRFAFEELPRQKLDKQAQKMAESAHAAALAWAAAAGEGADYEDNLPAQCLHPVGHWFEVANLLRNGTLARLWQQRPSLRHLLLHNIDTLGADLDPALLGHHASSGASLTFEVVPRCIDDAGGGLARVDGALRLVEGMALPHEPDAWGLSWYSTMTTWIDLEALLGAFRLQRSELGDERRVAAAVRELAARLPTYVTLKEVKKRWGLGQEDVLPVAQFEKLWGDMSVLPELDCRYVAVPRVRGQQLKEPAQLDGWLRDGSADAVAALCHW